MPWSRFDDGYDEHERVENAWFAFPPNPVGLHVMATTACNRWQSDGVIRPRWLTTRLPDRKDRERILAYVVANALFDFLAAGATRELVDSDGNRIVVGPYEEDRYLVHDFLDRHESSVQTRARRALDSERKRKGRRPESAGSPGGIRADSDVESGGSPLTRGSARPQALPDPTHPNKTEREAATPQSASAREHTSGSLVETVRCPRCGAEPGAKCMGVRKLRESAHLERHHAVGELTHITPSRGGRRAAPRTTKMPYAASAEWTAVRDEHFPGVEVVTIEGVVFTLRQRRREPTVDAIREVLEWAAA